MTSRVTSRSRLPWMEEGGDVIRGGNPDVVYASLGHEWRVNAERGVFRTTDGGASWKKVLYVDENTGLPIWRWALRQFLFGASHPDDSTSSRGRDTCAPSESQNPRDIFLHKSHEPSFPRSSYL